MSIDINEVKKNTEDINNNNGGTSLDNLLNIGNTPFNKKDDEYITPAEKIVKANDVDDEDDDDEVSDYFKMPEQFTSLEINPSISILENDKYTVNDAIEELRSTINKLKDKGIKIDMNEMNFDKSYQMIVKIDKE